MKGGLINDGAPMRCSSPCDYYEDADGNETTTCPNWIATGKRFHVIFDATNPIYLGMCSDCAQWVSLMHQHEAITNSTPESDHQVDDRDRFYKENGRPAFPNEY